MICQAHIAVTLWGQFGEMKSQVQEDIVNFISVMQILLEHQV